MATGDNIDVTRRWSLDTGDDVNRGLVFRSSPLLLVVLLFAVVAIVVPSTVATESSRPEQWAIDMLSLDRLSPDDWTPVVAVLDTDIAAGHQDLVGVLLRGYDFIEDRVFDPAAPDRQLAAVDHGTMVSSIIAAPDDEHGIRGVAPGVRILPVRIVPDTGQGNPDDMAAGINWALDNGADLINVSIRTSQDSPAVRSAIDRAAKLGIPVIASAGLGPTSVAFYPAAYESVIAVAALASSLEPYSGSPAAPYVDVAAPGFDIIAAGGSASDVYLLGKGTSFAAPHVTGLLVLMMQVAPEATVLELRRALFEQAIDLGPVGRDDVYGVGLIDPAATLVAIGPVPAPSNVTGLRFGNSVWLNWNEGTDSGRIAGYEVLFDDRVVVAVGADRTSVLAPAVTFASVRTYGVRSVAGDGRASPLAGARTSGDPRVPPS